MDGDKVQEYQALKKDVELFPNLDQPAFVIVGARSPRPIPPFLKG